MSPLRTVTQAIVFAVSLLAAAHSQPAAGDPADGNPRTVYFSTGDHQDLLTMLPLDSAATIEAAFDAIQLRYQASRVWWRGGQDEVWGNQFVIREENRMFWRLWEWWKDCQYRRDKLNAVAVEAAHKRGMEIWLTYGLFDNGSQADAGYVGFPYAAEDKLRIDHPAWAPVNRWGTWRQGGPIEFAYPEARREMADYLAKYVVEGGYDGLAFLTYAENFSQRYEEEFGYNEPVVREFQRRHGVDIRREPFDRQQWSRLRGEYVEAFLRELRGRLSAHGKKLAICVDGGDPARPVPWNVDGGVRTAGALRWSPEDWVETQTVDEMCLFRPIPDNVMHKWQQVRQSGRAKMDISAFFTRGDLPRGMPRIMFLGRDIESGFDWEAYVDYPDEMLPPEPAESLSSADVFARRRLLTCALRGTTAMETELVAKALRDPDVYVRRTALRVLAARKDAAGIPAAAETLGDPENSVRCQAALALAEMPDPQCVQRMLSTIDGGETTFQFHYRAVPEVLLKLSAEGRLTEQDKALLVARLADPRTRIRELVLYYFIRIDAPATPDVMSKLLDILQNDENPYARELAIVNLQSSFGPAPDVTRAVESVMADDTDHAVQLRAAVAFAGLHARTDPGPARQQALAAAIEFFRQYGDGRVRTDREWGWRALGNTILLFGKEGEEALRGLMRESDNRALSERAWRILHLRQGDQFYPITEAQDAAAHELHPWLSR